ncbi:hypothetical protein B0H12DRAFT_1110387 [Mycena haematopus]|nr:hypothetical protein B0H12DRAFT_1110387 [Mycena haematopus]
MGLSSSKPRHSPYPLLTPGYNVPYGQDPNQYLPPQLQVQSLQNSASTKRRKRKSKRGSVTSQERIAQAYVQGWHAGNTGMGPVQPIQPAAPQENTRPVIPPPPAPVAPVNPVQPNQFAGGAFPPQQPQQQEPQAAPQFVQPQANVQERANPDIARVLQPLPPPAPAVFGPPPLQQSQPLAPLSNPLPAPPRDLYELSPYNTLLNLPQTTALLTAAYSQPGGLPPPSYGRRGGNRTGGLLRALTGRGRKEEDVRFVPVFINGQPPPPANPGAGAPAAQAAVAPTTFPQQLYDPPVPPFSASQAGSDGRRSIASTVRPPIRFSISTPQYHAFLTYSPHRVVYDEVTYPTAMHLHEALKYLPTNPAFAERIRTCPDAAGIHALSTQLETSSPNSVRPDWSAVYLQCMEDVLLLKFRQHADLRALLLGTWDAPLIYAEPDTYWGEAGSNHLGHILERVRTELRRELV